MQRIKTVDPYVAVCAGLIISLTVGMFSGFNLGYLIALQRVEQNQIK